MCTYISMRRGARSSARTNKRGLLDDVVLGSRSELADLRYVFCTLPDRGYALLTWLPDHESVWGPKSVGKRRLRASDGTNTLENVVSDRSWHPLLPLVPSRVPPQLSFSHKEIMHITHFYGLRFLLFLLTSHFITNKTVNITLVL